MTLLPWQRVAFSARLRAAAAEARQRAGGEASAAEPIWALATRACLEILLTKKKNVFAYTYIYILHLCIHEFDCFVFYISMFIYLFIYLYILQFKNPTIVYCNCFQLGSSGRSFFGLKVKGF